MGCRKISSQALQDETDINAHVWRGDTFQASDSSSGKPLRSGLITHGAFEVGGGQLNQGLEEVALFRVVSRSMPERFEYLM